MFISHIVKAVTKTDTAHLLEACVVYATYIQFGEMMKFQYDINIV